MQQDTTAEASAPTTEPRSPLAMIFAVLIIVALIASNLLTAGYAMRIHRLLDFQQEEVRTYRNQLGMLNVDDPSKAYYLKIEDSAEGHWEWQIYLPEGSLYRLNIATGEIPATGFPSEDVHVLLKPGETTVIVDVDHVDKEGWKLEVNSIMHANGMHWVRSDEKTFASQQEMGWNDDYHDSTRRSLYEPLKDQVEFSHTEPTSLLRRRQWRGDVKQGERVDESLPSDGIVFWLEPTKETDENGS